ncbi:MarR family transcriptional regulator [Photobacterium aquae]|uniref:MarR family transcriptional regulator n=1 Tax=Photobacterium aquae TaxID=1195763 RepID=A0A0J1GYB3_9GAMM|nr:MarR family winged helix-turn-helix transcriptional regulator [Photobacterium aquae]KLV04660.1 MarR family transcriptional regulator [Photobacterium aquae]
MDTHEEVLVAIRQIIRAIDLHSKKLNKELGLTGPQLIMLRAIRDSGEVTIKQLSATTNISQATATSVIDRLVARQLVERVRSTKDRRIVHAVLTEKGKQTVETAPLPLQATFIESFSSLNEWEQTQILATVQRVSMMMNAHGMAEPPLLDVDNGVNNK